MFVKHKPNSETQNRIESFLSQSTQDADKCNHVCGVDGQLKVTHETLTSFVGFLINMILNGQEESLPVEIRYK